ncbi:GGDEF domain-containing protein [Sphingoaurantiacus capsulatus]|uniref:diguanylate cyclase n=1 Tax=Sphingoaurantiacus capsulatus TaxID=1771310 RepID=A0ABV7XBT2_9SPHN
MDKPAEIVERIRVLMLDGGIAPSPANYEFWYRYVTGADAQLVEAVDTVRRNAGRVSARSMDLIRRELYGRALDDNVVKLLDQTQSQLNRMAVYVVQTEGDTRTFTEALRDGQATLASAHDPEMQRALLTEMVNATAAMIEKTERLESELMLSVGEIAKLREDLERERSESRTDTLTGLPNRKAFNAYLEAQAARALADRKPLSLLFGDIDHFKRFNDTWGHRLGDEVLRLVGQSFEQMCHGTGYAARYGGEEFVVVLPGKALEAAEDIAEQFRDFIASRTVRTRQSSRDIGSITMSLGIAQLRWTDTLDQLIERADAALYRAKEMGRNRVCTELELEEAAA